MFSTCIFCNGALGANEVVESFPVGRRLAFDPEKGRLWVVCRKCEQWNLSPLEERWEAFEECERLFRAARMRMSTDQIGLARIPGGLELVRVGRPLRPEFAAWRYGDQFGRRRQRAMLYAAGGIVVVGAFFAGVAATGVGVGGAFQLPRALLNMPVRARVRTRSGQVLKLRRRDLQKVRIASAADDGFSISVTHKKRVEVFQGAEARRAAGIIVPKLNFMSGSKSTIAEAVAKIEDAGHPDRFISRMLIDVMLKAPRPWSRVPLKAQNHNAISKFPAATRLALEMALHEEQEQRALEGELAELERAWRDAEEIAAIADNLLLPPDVEAKFRTMHDRTSTSTPEAKGG